MTVFKPGKRAAVFGATAAILLTMPALAQTTGSPPHRPDVVLGFIR